MLLPKIRAALKQEAGSSKPRVLFVHLMGSHPTFLHPAFRPAGRI